MTEQETALNSPSQEDRGHLALIDFLSFSDTPCPNCGYNLRGLQSDRCPECGLRLMLVVNLAEARIWRIVAGVIPLSASGGFSVLTFVLFALTVCIVIMGGSADFSDLLDVPWQPVLATGLGFAVSTGLVIAWLCLRRWVRQRSRSQAWLLIVLCWLVPLANVAGFYWSFFTI